MHKIIEIEGKKVDVEVTDEAEAILSHRSKPILAELELYFSCLIRKQVRFSEQNDDGTNLKITENLTLSFRPVMTESCDKHYAGEEPPTVKFPIKKVRPFVPSWVKIDFTFGKWQGEFGYTED